MYFSTTTLSTFKNAPVLRLFKDLVFLRRLIDYVRINTIYANITEIKKSNVIDISPKDFNNS